jgi:GNAT superfamily N-acetyltransferase
VAAETHREGEISIRPAARDDVPLVHGLIVELADYERAREMVTGTPELLEEALFGEAPVAEALIAEVGAEAVGFALFYTTFSTWLCRPGIWLEDIYVRPTSRRGGVGRALLARVAQIAVQRGCRRLEWSVLDWNTPALDFYARIGAAHLHEWKVFRLQEEPLRQIAGELGAAR